MTTIPNGRRCNIGTGKKNNGNTYNILRRFIDASLSNISVGDILPGKLKIHCGMFSIKLTAVLIEDSGSKASILCGTVDILAYTGAIKSNIAIRIGIYFTID
jgi:hypothetical protein